MLNSIVSIARRPALHVLWCWTAVMLLAGCGTSVRRNGTEQLLASDAVDRTVSQLDFSLLADRKVFFDTKYITPVKDVGFVNSSYIVSSVRQQMSAAGCRLQDTADKADYIVEARVGALGTDLHDVTYGLPASSALTAASTVLSSLPAVPTIPEISLAKRNDQSASAKIAVFAYHRESRTPVWQSGIASAKSSAKDTWVLGAGPIQRGTIYDGVQFAGNRVRLPFANSATAPAGLEDGYASSQEFMTPAELEEELAIAKAEAEAKKAREAALAAQPKPATPDSGVQQAGHTEAK